MPLTYRTEENLKQFALDVHNFAYGTKWDDEDIVSTMDFDDIIEKMKKNENELIKKAEEQPREDQWPIAYREKNEQIEKLKKHIQTVAKVQGGQMERDADNLAEAALQIKELKKENAELKENLKDQELLEKVFDELKIDLDGLKELKKENAELQKEIDYTDNHIYTLMDTLEVGNLESFDDAIKLLKKENAELKEKLDMVGDYSISASIKVQSDLD
jgi:DNA repair exonuclease SbcCD ATPase subunit